ncbi:thioester reductase domain-containing protein [Streptomyces sp. NPDC127595]|uniref:thioester reductase domain-containing protein n=1 Tax=Streptomyces sp. NPDC127595 TaxID=3345405 RepID=UPI003644B9F7
MSAPTVLLTGATGFLGAHLLAELAAAGAREIRCLVRAPDSPAAAERLRAAAARYGLAEPSRAVRSWPGDLGRPRLGLDSVAYAALGRGLDLVVHAGARVNLALPYEALKPVNVDGTQEILRLAAQGPTPVPVHHISTLAVFGPDTPVEETLRLPAPTDLASGYEQSKWVADRLAATAAERGLPVAIHRTGRLFVNSATAGHNPQDLLVQVLTAVVRLGTAPDYEAVLRPAPVDWTAGVLRRLALAPDGLGRAYHLTGQQPLPWSAVLDAVDAGGPALPRTDYRRWLRLLTEHADHSGDEVLRRLTLVLGARPPFLGEDAGTPANARSLLGPAFDREHPASAAGLVTRLVARLAAEPPSPPPSPPPGDATDPGPAPGPAPVAPAAPAGVGPDRPTGEPYAPGGTR